jgi:hypothetical protein
MAVRLESAGSHAFNLGHLRREGGEELVERLLANAGFADDRTWRLQVQKKRLCNSETPPVRVVDGPKKWAVYLKIKPGDNNSCHYCSLLMPDGLQGQTVYHALKAVALTFGRNWRNTAVDNADAVPPVQAMAGGNCRPPNVPTTEARAGAGETAAVAGGVAPPTAGPPAPPPPAPPPTRGGQGGVAGGKSAVRGWLGDRDKIRLLLLAIHEISQEGACPQDRFAELLCDRMGWEGANRYEVGGVLTSLVRKDYIARRLRGSRPFGYLLTEEGLRVIADLVHPAAPVAGAP